MMLVQRGVREFAKRNLKNNMEVIVYEPVLIILNGTEILNSFCVQVSDKISGNPVAEFNVPKALPDVNTLMMEPLKDIKEYFKKNQEKNDEQNKKTADEIANYVDKLFS